jgi:hypothetical protein
MADLGDLMGSLMSGLIRARRIADEQTAALAEYYKTNPLLEGLSVPRIRIPELTIDMPLLIEDYAGGEVGQIEGPAKIATAAESQLKSTSSRNNIKINADLQKAFVSQVKSRVMQVKQSGGPVTRETVVRSVQDAFSDALIKTKSTLTASERETIAKDLRAKVSAIGIAKEPVTPSIVANIKTADVKERASDANVVRLKITMKEEGLEWAIQASESGGIVRTLQPE